VTEVLYTMGLSIYATWAKGHLESSEAVCFARSLMVYGLPLVASIVVARSWVSRPEPF